jgi:hypothetical protein
MKKLLCFVFLSGWVMFGLAQDQNTATPGPKNVVKFLPVNLPFQSISFEFERMIGSKNAITIGIGLPQQKSIMNKYGMDGSDFNTAKFGTMHIRAAYRHYTGDMHLPQGFYIEPYLKYQSIIGDGDYTGTLDVTNEPYNGKIDTKSHTINMGFQMGAQFLIAKIVTIDLYFLGLEAGILNGNVHGVTDKLPGADKLKRNFDKNIADMPSFIRNKMTTSQSGNVVDADATSLLYPWLRCGISLGIAF